VTQRPRHIPNLADRAWEAMPSAYRGAERIEALIRAQAAGMQAAEDMASDVQFSTHWRVAEGDALDQWGRMVGRARTALPDRIYRYLVEGQIRATHSAGTAGDLLAVYETVTGARETRIWTHPTGGVRLEALRLDWMPLEWVHAASRVMDVARPAGVELQLVEYIPETARLSDGDPDLDDESLLAREI